MSDKRTRQDEDDPYEAAQRAEDKRKREAAKRRAQNQAQARKVKYA